MEIQKEAQEAKKAVEGLTNMLRMRVVTSRLTATLYSRWLNHHLMRYSLHSCRAPSACPCPGTTGAIRWSWMQAANLLGFSCGAVNSDLGKWNYAATYRPGQMLELEATTLDLSCSSQHRGDAAADKDLLGRASRAL